MANYNVDLNCGNDSRQLIVVGVTFPVNEGDVIDFLINGIRFCGTIINEEINIESTYIALNVYESCEECLNPDSNPSRSANTEYSECVICCPCDSGSTVNEVLPPHPVWSDGYGTSVTQLNMVTLGGMKGLNS